MVVVLIRVLQEFFSTFHITKEPLHSEGNTAWELIFSDTAYPKGSKGCVAEEARMKFQATEKSCPIDNQHQNEVLAHPVCSYCYAAGRTTISLASNELANAPTLDAMPTPANR